MMPTAMPVDLLCCEKSCCPAGQQLFVSGLGRSVEHKRIAPCGIDAVSGIGNEMADADIVGSTCSQLADFFRTPAHIGGDDAGFAGGSVNQTDLIAFSIISFPVPQDEAAGGGLSADFLDPGFASDHHHHRRGDPADHFWNRQCGH